MARRPDKLFAAVGRLKWVRNDLGLEHAESLGRADSGLMGILLRPEGKRLWV